MYFRCRPAQRAETDMIRPSSMPITSFSFSVFSFVVVFFFVEKGESVFIYKFYDFGGRKKDSFLVSYTFKSIDDNTTEFEYYVRTEVGELDEPSIKAIKNIVEKLKIVLEK